MTRTEAALRALEDELQRRVADGSEYAALAQEVNLPLNCVVQMVGRSGDRLLGPRRERDRRARRPTEIESFEERDLRLGARRTNNHPWSAAKVSKRLDLAVETAGQIWVTHRECPVCLRRFTGRRDRMTCTDHCRDLARRVYVVSSRVSSLIQSQGT